MNANNNQLFDDLIRQKLEGYSEPPDMQLMQHIHAKKTRIQRWYGVYRLLIIVTAIGLSLSGMYFGTVFTSEEASNQSNQAVTPPFEKTMLSTPVSESAVEPTRNTTAQPVLSNESQAPAYSSTSPASQTKINTGGASNNRTTRNVSKQAKPVNPAAHPASARPEKAAPVVPASKNQVTPLVQPADQSVEVEKPSTNNKADQKHTDKETETACGADFNFYKSYSGEFQFSDLSIASGIVSYSWDFGDGSRSNFRSPSHTYNKSGTYQVQLTINNGKGCSMTQTKQVVIRSQVAETKTPTRLLGQIRAGHLPLNDATVELIPADQNSGQESYRVRTNKNGEFFQENIKPGRYVLAAYPTDATPEYIKTFWGNESDINYAPEVVITSNENEILSGYTIDLIYQGNNKNQPDMGGDLAQNTGQPVLLFDENHNLVGYGSVDANGKISYNGKLSGNFTVMDQKTGIIRGVVQLDQGGSTGGGGSAGKSSGNLKDGPMESAPANVTLNPNPASEYVNVNMEGPKATDILAIFVLDNNGKEMMRNNPASGGNLQVPLDISKLPAGVYYVMVMLKNGTLTSTRLQKNDMGTGLTR